MVNNNKNTLMIMPIIPCDTGNGAQRRAAAHLKSIAKIRNIYLIIFEAMPGRAEPINTSLAELCEFVKVVHAAERPRKTLSTLPLFTLLSEIISPRIKRIVPENDKLVKVVEQINHIIFDEVFCFKTRTAVILERMLNVTALKIKRKIVDFDDIESSVQIRSEKLFNEKVGVEISLVKKMTLWQQKYIENKFIRSFSDVLICSQVDKETLESQQPTAKIHVIPNSVCLEDINKENTKSDKINILFVGSMSYGPNQDGVLWFFNEIFPSVMQKTNNDLSFYIVGFNPSDKILDLEKNENVTVTGGVDSVSPYYHQSNIVIAPIRYGGGTRIKILEAMGFQRAVISTTIGAEGIDITDKKDIIIADSPENFANSCIRLIENKDCRRNIGIAARHTIEEKYNDNEISKKIHQLFQ